MTNTASALTTGTTYYVDPAGSDSNSGTSPGSAWQTLSKVDSVTFQPGDQILFKAGGSWTGVLHPLGSGSADAPIRIDRYGTGSDPEVNAAMTAGATVVLDNQQYWEIRHLNVTNNNGSNPTTGTYRGVSIMASDFGIVHHIYLQYLTVHDIDGEQHKAGSGAAIWFQITGTTTPTAFDDVLIDSNTIQNIGTWTGIGGYSTWSNRSGSPATWFGSTHVQISNNYLDHIGGDGIVPEEMTNPIIEYNYVQYAHSGPYDYAVAIWPWSDDQATFRYNEAAFTQTTLDGQAYDMDGENNQTLYEYNYSHDNQGGFIQLSGAGPYNNNPVFRYNISQNDQNLFIGLWSKSNDGQIYNNTVYVSPGIRQQFISGTSGWYPANTLVANNIYDNQGSGGTIPSNMTGTTITHNNFYGPGVASATLNADSSKVTGNPLFVNPDSGGTRIDMRSPSRLSGYALQSGSPDLGKGMAIAQPLDGDGQADFVGHLVPNPPDIGAMQYGSTTPAGLQNADFGSGSLADWAPRNATVSTTNVRSGSYSVALAPTSDSAIEQTVNGLSPSTTYTFTGYGMVTNAGDKVYVGVKNFGGAQVSSVLGTQAYSPCGVTFTTGPTNTSARVYFYRSGGTGTIYGADFNLNAGNFGRDCAIGAGGATNIALGKTATASSIQNSSYPASNAVDGNSSTRWSSAFSDPQWIQIDLGRTYNITGAQLQWETAYGKAYQIQVSNDASTWTTVYSTTNGTGGTENLSFTGTGRYIRMYGTQRGTQWGYSLWEFQVFGT